MSCSGDRYTWSQVWRAGYSAEEGVTGLWSEWAGCEQQGMAHALGRYEDHSRWFAYVCEALLPNYAYSLGVDRSDGSIPDSLPVIPLRANVPAYAGPALPWPPGWAALWSGTRGHFMSLSDPVRY